MPFKTKVGSILRAVGRMPGLSAILYAPTLRSKLQQAPGFRHLYEKGWGLLHPFDIAHGTDTSGYVPSKELPNSPVSSTHLHVYGGSQPSIVRAALQALPPPHDYSFVDLGCGKGRPVLIASEFAFRECVGVELSPQLAGCATRNLVKLRAVHPDCAPMRIVQGDAAAFDYPPGNLVIFLYNPFGEEVIKRVVGRIEEALAENSRGVFVVYYNPVWGKCFDASPQLHRYLALTIPYAAEELGFGPDDSDPVVIWQGGSAFTAHAGAAAKIEIVNPDHRVALRD